MSEQFEHPEIPTENWDDTTTEEETVPELVVEEPESDLGFDEQEVTNEVVEEQAEQNDYSFTDMGRLFLQVFGHPQQASDAIDDYGLTEEEINTLLEDPNSYLAKILSTITTQYTKQTMFQFRALTEAFSKIGRAHV